MQVGGFVLAGGMSTRMGRDKALLELDGEPLIARALASLAEVCAEVAIAGGKQRLEPFGRVICDRTPGLGPLSGIVAALEQSSWEWNLFVPVDVPFIPKEAWLRLIETAEHTQKLVVMARVGGQSGGQVQPLCAAYRKAAASLLRDELLADRKKVTGAVAAAGGAEYVDFMEADWFRNFNTLDEFAALSTRQPHRIT